MSLLVTRQDLFERREIVRGPLRPLAASLAADLAPLLNREIYFPADKALLSREGGRCPRDGTQLEFDPFQPHDHRCGHCGHAYRGNTHDRFWIYWYQLWLAERAVHAAALNALGVDARFGPLAAEILEGYAVRYMKYPNIDNVLGPSRMFFSTYLESIWLLQICVAVDMLDGTLRATSDRVRDRIIDPARSIIAEYDEGDSNRQIWNDAALLAAAIVLDDQPGAETVVHGKSGIATHLANGLLSDGTWFEGENYHLFAHRGLWYCVTLAEHAGFALPTPLIARFQRGFATPFSTALPDLTLPSRRDSHYAISLRQWRIAEQLELGIARARDPELLGALARLYGDDDSIAVPRRDTGRKTSSAEVERNAKPSALTRTDLGWRALLCALPSLPPLEPIAPRSTLLAAQGIGVFRRDGGKSYVALDYGTSGGGHGHPDRLNVLLSDGDTRWLDDYGTGSYVDASLHWYRSTLAHNAPLIDGRSQLRVSGDLLAYDERGAAGWIVAAADGIAPGVSANRTVVVLPGYLIDELEWHAEHDVTVDLPFHVDAELDGGVCGFEAGDLNGTLGYEDGFRFASDPERQLAAAGVCVHGRATNRGSQLDLWARSDRDTAWWRAVAPGPPEGGNRRFRFVRMRAQSGRHQTVMSWRDEVTEVDFGHKIRVTMRDGSIHTHRRTEAGWQIELAAGSARSSIDLGGFAVVRADRQPTTVRRSEKSGAVISVTPDQTATVDLAERNYRRSEQTWVDAGRPTAQVTVRVSGAALVLEIRVATSDLTFAAQDAANSYDNERADINGDGVQIYVRGAQGLGAWMLVPEPGATTVRVRSIDGWPAVHAVRATWHRDSHGYRMQVELEPVPEALDVIINEMPHGRERRRGQLVMSGAQGEFVYLRGDRHEAAHLVALQVTNG